MSEPTALDLLLSSRAHLARALRIAASGVGSGRFRVTSRGIALLREAVIEMTPHKPPPPATTATAAETK
jgi:hypothetical protein